MAKAINLYFDKGENIIIQPSEKGVNVQSYEKMASQDSKHFNVAECSQTKK